MWIFGFGSLMADGWEVGFDCTNRELAELVGYRRVFNKLSVKNWGTPDCPCPTLNVEAAAGATCVGVAFEFDDSKIADVDRYLAEREGKNFRAHQVDAKLRDGRSVVSRVWIYEGKHVSLTLEPEALVRAVCHATGTSGRCYEYIKSIYEQLAEMGIDDAAVTQLWLAVSNRRR
jgi:glutathione-specific gamma-glutamylcyclotransferase